MIKILDVSNSINRPIPRGLGGPIENDIVRYLKKYAHKFNCAFVLDEKDADIIFTNDVFPKKYQQPKIKRMDGIYSREDLLNRNENLNLAATTANCVIFISEFSKESLSILYPKIKIKKSIVALNSVDPKEFFPINNISNNKIEVISVANNWSRPEKRGSLIIELAKNFNNINFNLIGSVDQYNIKNINTLGYISNYQKMNELINKNDSFIYLGYNDPAPKTVCQALNCKVPLFLTNSGGNRELAQDFAYYIKEDNFPKFHEKVPELNIDEIVLSFNEYLKYLLEFKNKIQNYNSAENFENMLEKYFTIFKENK